MPSNRNNVWENIGYWLAEIVVVFIGAYLAFLLNGYRIERQQEQKKQQIYTALYQNFSNYAKIKENNSRTHSLYIQPFLKAYENKNMPRLKKWPFLTLGISENTWTAMLQSGGINLLDVELIRQISYFYSNLERLRQESNHFNKMTAQYLVPNIHDDISTFYNTDTKKLRPKFNWYIRFIKYYKSELDQINAQAKEVLNLLRKRMNTKQMQKNKADSTE